MARKLLISLAAAAVATLPVSAQTVDEIITKNIQAHGGMEKLKATKTIRMTGSDKAGSQTGREEATGS